MPKNSRGAAPLILIVVVLAVVAAGGYLLYSKGGISLPGTSLLQRATEKDFEFIEDATLRKHFVAQANQASYRTKTYSEAADLNFTMEVQIKGENFNTRDQEFDPTGKETKHKIQIGDTTYVKDYSDGKWWKQTLEPEEIPEGEEEEPVDFKEEFSKPDLQFKSLGKEACGNLTCFKYEQLLPGLGLAATRIFWFDDRQYLLRKEESVQGEFKLTIEYSYDGINIIAPSPTKDVPEGANIYDYYYGTYSGGSTTPSVEIPSQVPAEPAVPEGFSPEEIGY